MIEHESARIRINLLGNFEIFMDGELISKQLESSKKMKNILEYLILNKDRKITFTELEETLWPEEKLSNPSNALKTALHRMRNHLGKYCTEEEEREFIITKRGSYQWNPDIACSIDIYEFEELLEKVEEESLSYDEKITLYQKILALYKGDLFQASERQEWLGVKVIHYRNLFIKGMHKYTELLAEGKRFHEIIQVCKKVLEVDPFDEFSYFHMMNGYYITGQPKSVVELYDLASELFYKERGIELSDKIKQVYIKTLQTKKDLEFDIDRIKEALEAKIKEKGVFICDYEVFKSIFRFQARSLERQGGTACIALITLTSKDGSIQDKDKLAHAMEGLLVIIKKSLRKEDVAAQYSALQFVMLLPFVNEKIGNVIMERINKNFKRSYPRSSFIIDFKLRIMHTLSFPEQD